MIREFWTIEINSIEDLVKFSKKLDEDFLCHGSSIYGSFVTEKGEALIQALEEMSKYEYEYEDFYDNNVIAVMEGE